MRTTLNRSPRNWHRPLVSGPKSAAAIFSFTAVCVEMFLFFFPLLCFVEQSVNVCFVYTIFLSLQ